jgi:tetratricopeptide (TPR) repeat protein
MTQEATTFTPENEKTYEALISLIENSQGRLAPIVVGCDDENLRSRVIDRYEAEAAKIPAYRITLGTEPSISRALAQLKASETYLQGSGGAVFTVTGAEYLLWIKTHEEDAQSELDKFFGYLQWTREALREYPYPIVIWVPHRILRQMSQRAPDFWSWRKAVLRFVDEEAVPAVEVDWDRSAQVKIDSEDTFLPPLEELLEEIQQLEARSPNSASLATLYHKLGKVYAWRAEHGKTQNFTLEQAAAIQAFEQAIINQKLHQDYESLVITLHSLSDFFHSQSRFSEAINTDQQSLEIARNINNEYAVAKSLGNLGVDYEALGQFQYAINFHQQALKIRRTIEDKHGEAKSLGNLGLAFDALGQHERGIDFHQEALNLAREIGDRSWEAKCLGNLGGTYSYLGQYQRAIDFHQEALNLARQIGDRQWEAGCLGNLGIDYHSLSQFQQALDFHQQALKIQREVGDKLGEAKSLGNLGSNYHSLNQFKLAIDFHQKSLEIERKIGNKEGEAISLFCKASALKSLSQTAEATQYFQQAKSIYSEIQIEHWAKRCDEELAKLQP